MNLQEKISIVIVNFNGASTLHRCIDSILHSTVAGCPLFVIDNGSTDDSISRLQPFLGSISLIRQQNVGYAEGANVGIRLSQSPYVLIANPDIVVSTDFAECLVRFMDLHPDAGACGGKLLRWDKVSDRATNIIDSCGIVRKGCDFIDRGSGTIDRGRYEKSQDVFAACGAALLLRRDALADIAVSTADEPAPSDSPYYFDPVFFAYKEDIDLCWRLRNKNWRCFYVPDAVAWHVRALQRGNGFLQRLRNKRHQSSFMRELSFRNHLRLLRKNEPQPSCSQRLGRVFYILRFALFSLLFSPDSLRCLFRKKTPFIIPKK